MFSRLGALREIAAPEIGWQTSQRVFDVARQIETLLRPRKCSRTYSTYIATTMPRFENIRDRASYFERLNNSF